MHDEADVGRVEKKVGTVISNETSHASATNEYFEEVRRAHLIAQTELHEIRDRLQRIEELQTIILGAHRKNGTDHSQD